MKATLPADRAIPVAGGAMTSSFAETKDGRLRQDHHAIGASTSVKVLVQSDRPISQDEARAAALKVVEYVLAHPPGI